MASLYDVTVPIFIRALENLKHVLSVGEKYANEKGIEHEKLINASLIDDMGALPFQVQSASNTSKKAILRLTGVQDPPMEDNEKTFAEFYSRIDKTVDFLKSVKREDFEGKENNVVSLMDGKMKFKPLEFVQVFGIPNFFFHCMGAYAILRKEGVPVGKLDYLAAGNIPSENLWTPPQ